jgi:hypothetical protein
VTLFWTTPSQNTDGSSLAGHQVAHGTAAGVESNLSAEVSKVL